MIIVQTSAPAVEPISLQAAFDRCRVIDFSESQKISELIAFARNFAEEQTGAALISRAFTAFCESWSTPGLSGIERAVRGGVSGSLNPPGRNYGRLLIQKAPIVSVESIQYYDASNVLRTLDASAYGKIPSAFPGVGGVFFTNSQSFPALAQRPDAVQINFTAGFGPTAATVPPVFVQAMMELIYFKYEEGSSVYTGMGRPPTEFPLGVRDLLRSQTISLVS